MKNIRTCNVFWKLIIIIIIADSSGLAVPGVGLRPLACWDRGFETHCGRGCLSLVSVVCCQVEVSASGWSLIQRTPTESGVSGCDLEASIMMRTWSNRDFLPWKKYYYSYYSTSCKEWWNTTHKGKIERGFKRKMEKQGNAWSKYR